MKLRQYISIMLLRNDSENFITISAMSFEKINFEGKWRCFYFALFIQMASLFSKLIYQQELSIIIVTSVKVWVQLNRNLRRSWSLKIRAKRYLLRSKHLKRLHLLLLYLFLQFFFALLGNNGLPSMFNSIVEKLKKGEKWMQLKDRKSFLSAC